MRDEIQVEEVFTENWEQLIDEIMEDGLDLVWNEKTEKYEKKWFFSWLFLKFWYTDFCYERYVW